MSAFESQTIQLVIIAIAALAVVLQAVILLGIFLGLKKAARSTQEQIAELRSSIMPLIDDSREFLTRVAPEIEATTTDVAAIVHGLRVHGAEMEATATDILGRVQHQTSRVDAMMTGVLDSVDRVGGFVAGAVNKPARQLFGILASIKAVVESLRAPAPQSRPTRTSAD
jgi:hypothetical protein